MPDEARSATINFLPTEIVEYIIGLVSPYDDLESCQLVCKKWSEIASGVIRKHRNRFLTSLFHLNIGWESLPSTQDLYSNISRRYSHAACYHDNAMYVFGGCTSTNTTFNDLWKLNLSTRLWNRALPIGAYPAPKACATLVHYKDSLFLYGGWAQSSAAQQVCHLFNELNIYRLKTNKWDCEYTNPSPPAAAGHSASIHGSQMIVFGGIRKQTKTGHPSQEIVCYNLENNSWHVPEIKEPKPLGRYGQTQVALDDKHLLIIGGCGGHNSIFNDIWMLSMEGTEWHWKEMVVESPEYSACDMWCSPGCQVDELVVFLCRRKASNTTSKPNKTSAKNHLTFDSHYNMSAQIRGRSVWVPPVDDHVENHIPDRQEPPKLPDEDKNVNGNRGSLRQRQQHDPRDRNPEEPVIRPANNQQHPRAGTKPSIRPNAMKNRGKQLEVLKNMEERIQWLRSQAREPSVAKAEASPSPSSPAATMGLCVLDTSRACSDHRVRWLRPDNPDEAADGSPEEAVLYSMVHGRGELVVFGGVQKFNLSEATTDSPVYGAPNVVSNAVHFIKAPRSVV